jgi:transposase
MADWLTSLDVEVVAMEATGVYWIPLYEVLDARGFQVNLVNSRATRQVSGRKSDVLDCQWIWQLMTYGLLKGAFRPGNEICSLRSVVRQRAAKVQEQSRCVQHMQKALTQMNIQLDNVVSNLTGKTGLAILRQIVAGERDPEKLATLRDRRLRASEQTVARSLHGNWREEHLFALTQALAHYDFLGQQIAECDETIGEALHSLPTLTDQPCAPVKAMRNPHRTSAQQAQLHQALNEVLGVDLTRVPTLGIDTVLVLASEVGADLSRFASARHFCSWLGLAPPTHISGGKSLGGPKPKVFNRAGQALRQAALNARRSQTFIGAAHRARLARMDTAKAVKATAHQLARLIYAMLTQGQEYVERGMEEFEVRSRDRQLRSLKRKARHLGLTLSEAA